MGFFRNAVTVLFTNAVAVPIGLATSVILARFLSVPDRGVYAVAIAFQMTAVLVCQLGWPAASIYRLRRVGSAPAQVMTAGLIGMTAVSVTYVAVCLAFEAWIREALLEGAPREVFFLAMAGAVPQLYANVLTGIARGLDRFDLHNGYRFVEVAGTLAMTTFALIVRDGGVVEALAAIVMLEATLALVVGLILVRNTGLTLALDSAELKQSLGFGLRNYAQWVSGNLHERVGIFLLAYLLRDPAQIAIYSIAVGAIQRIRIVPQSLALVLFPKLAGSTRNDALEFAAFVSRHSMFWVFVSVALLAPSAPFLIPLAFGEEYRASVAPFLVLLPGMAVITTYTVLSGYFTSLGRQRVNIVTQVISTLVNLGLSWLWIPRFGILGSAYASLTSYSLEAVLITGMFLREGQLGFRNLFVLGARDLLDYRQRLLLLVRRIRHGVTER